MSKTETTVNRWQKRQQQTRHDFLMAALALVLERGLAGTTVSEIARRANYGHSTFYLHFANKGEVMLAIFTHFMTELDAQIIAAVGHLPTPQREYQSWLIIIGAIDQNRDFFQRFQGQDALDLHLRQAAKAYLINQFEGHLRAGRFVLQPAVESALTARYFVTVAIDLLGFWLQNPAFCTATGLADRLFWLVFRQAPPNQEPDL
jgi:AcrR family transcriptional regulator